MSPGLKGSLMIQRFKNDDVIDICDRIIFDFFTWVPHVLLLWQERCLEPKLLATMLRCYFGVWGLGYCGTSNAHALCVVAKYGSYISKYESYISVLNAVPLNFCFMCFADAWISNESMKHIWAPVLMNHAQVLMHKSLSPYVHEQ